MRTFLLLVSLAVMSVNQSAYAFEFEKLFSPGDLISGHEEFDAECAKCHVRLSDTTQDQLCRDCHELVDEDILAKRGFHGKNKSASTLECKSCHADHKGRDASIVKLDKDRFDHDDTDFRLLGKHREAECKDCHEAEKKYRETEGQCYDCHAEDDAHDGDMGEKCDDCHNPEGWGGGKFDHDQTDFPLRFSHRKVQCKSCHIKGEYKKTPKECVSCHAIKDVHADRFGDQCDRCHRPEKWDKARFDHDRNTRFPLKGKHRNQSCHTCHAAGTENTGKDKKPRDCIDCHKADDIHNGLNGEDCEKCHVEDGWQLADFDHDKNTDFPLKGGHRELACQACHISATVTRKLDTSCYSCHASNDAHNGDQGENCNQCHNEVAWLHEVRFDHDLTAFPLIGQHAVTGCEACHVSSVFSETESRCIDCHRDDDFHELKLGEDCSRCHNPNDWLIWYFDHDETTFSLKFSHAEQHCHNCHKKPMKNYDARDWRCADCHFKDDVHEGNFGNLCDKCHNEESFDQYDIRSMNTIDSKVAVLGRERL